MLQSHSYCLTFSSLVREHWDELRQLTTERRYSRNQVIYRMGDAPDAVYRVEEGQVKVARLSSDGDEKTLDLYHHGDLFGELCVCGASARSEQAMAVEPTTVTCFNVTELRDVLKKKPELTLELVMFFCARLFECQEQVATLAFDEVHERLAKELLRLSRLPASQPGEGGIELAGSLTHQELANLVKTTRQNVTMIMNQFRRQGLLDYRRSAVRVFPERLEAYLNQSRL
ncbi:MAG: Crp/Fnr family transcriptional regulator [Acidobacteria bacterium]|nr:Crp/Fnr family transcriptional regulator [Acidobacteriota bacterium]